MHILAIESSCDETAAALIKDGIYEIASVIATSKELHEATGGVVPEIAARKQIEFILPVIEQTLKKFHATYAQPNEDFNVNDVKNKINAIAVTIGPGLIGSLLVGVEAAKALALAWDKPLIPVNHLVGHIYANFLEEKEAVMSHSFAQETVGAQSLLPEDATAAPSKIEFPVLGLVISGGHTDVVLMKNHGDLEYLGGTLDDAAGEAYDKTARLLGLAKYLGGAELSKLASQNTRVLEKDLLPRPMLDQDNFDFSFSGLKTAVKNLIEKDVYPKEVIAYEFEKAVTDVVVKKTVKAAEKYKVKQILVGGGVAANTYLRTRLSEAAAEKGIEVKVPALRLCTDNAVYIGAAAYFLSKAKKMVNATGILSQPRVNFNEIKANPSLGIMD